MATRPQDRDSLYTKLREVLGADQARTLMGLLPTEGDQLATKADLAPIDQGLDRIEERMDRFEERLWEFHEALRGQTRTYVAATVSSMFGVGSLDFAAAALL